MRSILKQRIPLTLAGVAVLVASMVGALTMGSTDVYVTVGHSMTRNVVGIPSEKLLVDYCTYLNSIEGVRSVTYGDYSPSHHTATITVFYDPDLASIRHIQTLMQYTKSMWEEPKST